MLKINNLTIRIDDDRILDDVNICIKKGETVSLVGGSGSGKTMTALAVMGVLPVKAVIESGEIIFKGSDLLSLDENKMREIRGNEISMVFQEPQSALNPLMTIKSLIYESILAHKEYKKSDLKNKTISLLESVKLDKDVMKKYPNQISGGMKQRAMIASAISCSPDLVVFDEPTTALDVFVQKHMLDLIREIKEKTGLSVLFITHDLSIVKMISDRIYIMNEGKVVEEGDAEQVLSDPKNEYTKKLIKSIPQIGL